MLATLTHLLLPDASKRYILLSPSTWLCDSLPLHDWLPMQSNEPCTQCLILPQAALLKAPIVLHISLCCLARELIISHETLTWEKNWHTISKKCLWHNNNYQQKKCDVDLSSKKYCCLFDIVDWSWCCMLIRINTFITSHFGIGFHRLMRLTRCLLAWAVKHGQMMTR